MTLADVFFSSRGGGGDFPWSKLWEIVWTGSKVKETMVPQNPCWWGVNIDIKLRCEWILWRPPGRKYNFLTSALGCDFQTWDIKVQFSICIVERSRYYCLFSGREISRVHPLLQEICSDTQVGRTKHSFKKGKSLRL
jgi:hypothetical protein